MTNPNNIQHPSDWIDPVGEDLALAWAHMYDDGPGYIPSIAEEHLAWIEGDGFGITVRSKNELDKQINENGDK